MSNYLMHYGVKGMKWGVNKHSYGEDGIAYKYNAPNESGWIGAARAIKAKRAEKRRITKSNVQRYSRAADRASTLQDAADAKWRSVRSQYKSLGRTVIGRARAVHKAQTSKGSKAANKYLKAWDSWEKLQDKADSAEIKRRETWKRTGKTYVSRVYNNVRYR